MKSTQPVKTDEGNHKSPIDIYVYSEYVEVKDNKVRIWVPSCPREHIDRVQESLKIAGLEGSSLDMVMNCFIEEMNISCLREMMEKPKAM